MNRPAAPAVRAAVTPAPLPLDPPRGPAATAGRLASRAFCVGFGGVTTAVGCWWAFAVPGPLWARAGVALLFGGFGVMFAALLWREVTAEYGWRGELDGVTLTIDRGGRRTVLDLRTLDRLDWPLAAGQSLAMSGPGGAARFTLSRLDPAVRLELIRRLRADVPADVQRRWPGYCGVALNLVRCDVPTRPLRPGERLETGEFSAGFGLVSVLIGEAGGFGLWWLTGQPRFLAFGTLVGLSIAGLRWWAAKTARPRIVRERPGESATTWTLAAAISWALLLGFPLMKWGGPAVPAWAWAAGFGPPAVLFAVGMTRTARLEEAARKSRTAAATAEWDALHAGRPADPAAV